MVTLHTIPRNVKLSMDALRTLKELLNRSRTQVAELQSLDNTVADILNSETSFFLHDTGKSMTSTLRETSTLLIMPREVARSVIYRIEEQIHRLACDDLSDEQWKKVKALADRLATQHPDHITNVIRLWQTVTKLQDGEVREGTVKDLGLLWQLQSAEAEVVLNELVMRMNKGGTAEKEVAALGEEIEAELVWDTPEDTNPVDMEAVTVKEDK